MSHFRRNRIPGPEEIKLTRQRIIVLLMVGLLLYVSVSVQSSSVTDRYGAEDDRPTYVDDPRTDPDHILDKDLTDLLGNSTYSDWTWTQSWPDPRSTSTTSDWTHTGTDSQTTDTDWTWTDWVPDPSDHTDDEEVWNETTTTDDPRQDQDMRPNKPRNLLNMSGILSSSFLGDLRVNIDMDINGTDLLFFVLLFFSLYLNQVVMINLQQRLREDGDEKVSALFVNPWLSPDRVRERNDRMRKIMGFRERVDMIIAECKVMLHRDLFEQVIIRGYHLLDHAFTDFSKLARSPAVTPMEHALSHFRTTEINYTVLERIVTRFYEVRFGNKSQNPENVQQFIEWLENLVIADLFEVDN